MLDEEVMEALVVAGVEVGEGVVVGELPATEPLIGEVARAEAGEAALYHGRPLTVASSACAPIVAPSGSGHKPLTLPVKSYPQRRQSPCAARSRLPSMPCKCPFCCRG